MEGESEYYYQTVEISKKYTYIYVRVLYLSTLISGSNEECYIIGTLSFSRLFLYIYFKTIKIVVFIALITTQ